MELDANNQREYRRLTKSEVLFSHGGVLQIKILRDDSTSGNIEHRDRYRLIFFCLVPQCNF